MASGLVILVGWVGATATTGWASLAFAGIAGLGMLMLWVDWGVRRVLRYRYERRGSSGS